MLEARRRYHAREITKAEYIRILRELITLARNLNGYKKYERSY